MTKNAKRAFADDLSRLFTRLDSLEAREETEADKKARDILLAKIDTYARALFLTGYGFNTEYRDGFEVVEIIKR